MDITAICSICEEARDGVKTHDGLDVCPACSPAPADDVAEIVALTQKVAEMRQEAAVLDEEWAALCRQFDELYGAINERRKAFKTELAAKEQDLRDKAIYAYTTNPISKKLTEYICIRVTKKVACDYWRPEMLAWVRDNHAGLLVIDTKHFDTALLSGAITPPDTLASVVEVVTATIATKLGVGDGNN